MIQNDFSVHALVLILVIASSVDRDLEKRKVDADHQHLKQLPPEILTIEIDVFDVVEENFRDAYDPRGPSFVA